MSRKKELQELLKELKKVLRRLDKFEKKYSKQLSKVHPDNYLSALNLIHYIALRSEDIRPIQIRLGKLGLSRLGRSEKHVLGSILALRHTLRSQLGGKLKSIPNAKISINKGKKLLSRNTKALLGRKRKGANTRIMVTLPLIAVEDKELVNSLVKAGMSISRINCSHDTRDDWKKMAERVRKAHRKTGKTLKIAMDLGGPKLRTGSLTPGPRVVRLKPKRDIKGRTVSEPWAWLSPLDTSSNNSIDYVHIPIAAAFVKQISSRSIIEFRDTRGKHCKLKVERIEKDGVWVRCDRSAYLETGTELWIEKRVNVYRAKVGELPRIAQAIVLREGDNLEITRESEPGVPAQFDDDLNVTRPARISCQVPEIFEELNPGESIMLDDGKLVGEITEVDHDRILVHVNYAVGGALKLKADKGINLPHSNLSVSGLTRKDREDLEFAVDYADMVSLSFVNSASDVIELCDALDEHSADDMGVILKIETLKGFKKLPEILLAGMRRYPLGVMIARGDLAIETGWENLARIQEEILWMCEAAHVPIVWATQVLESLAKKGQPSRAEISDVSIAERAECVMLNKGPHIVQTVEVLSEILQSMEGYQDKKAPLLPIWHIEK